MRIGRSFFYIYWGTVLLFLFGSYLSLPNPSGKIENELVRAGFALFDTVSAVLITYFILHVLIPKYTKSKNIYKLILFYLLIVATFTSLRFSIDYYFLKRHFSQEVLTNNIVKSKLMIGNLLYDNFMLLFLLPLSYSGIKFLSDWYTTQNRLHEIEHEKIQTELSFLKAQLNPHFLFNSINSIYGHIDKKNIARLMLLKFSDMLRYQLYECNTDKIPVEREIEYLNNFIDLQKMRKSEKLNVSVCISADIRYFEITPLVFIPFVENAFKYVSNHDKESNFVDIKLKIENRILVFTCSNSIDNLKARELINRDGIGIKNIQRRLKLLYPGKHELITAKNESNFVVELRIEI